ncbi:MAG: VOC family protein [Candidatus Kapaibacterium sp.]
MAEFTKHEPHTFCWLDLGTSDTASAKEFYSELFGWEPFDTPAGEEGVYTMLNKNGKPAAALYELSEQQKQMNIPPHWMTYITVDDAEESSKKADSLGGKILMGPIDVMGEGKMSLVQDPEGGLVGLWQPMKHIGAAYKQEHGALAWTEFGTHDKSKPVPFYEGLCGWKADTQPMGEGEYTLFKMGEQMAAGLYEMPEGMEDIPPHWLPYIQVDNIDKALETVDKHDGEIMMPKMHAPGVGHFSVVRDPQGAVFGLIQSDM